MLSSVLASALVKALALVPAQSHAGVHADVGAGVGADVGAGVCASVGAGSVLVLGNRMVPDSIGADAAAAHYSVVQEIDTAID